MTHAAPPSVSCVRGCSRETSSSTPTSVGVPTQRQSVLGRSRGGRGGRTRDWCPTSRRTVEGRSRRGHSLESDVQAMESEGEEAGGDEYLISTCTSYPESLLVTPQFRCCDFGSPVFALPGVRSVRGCVPDSSESRPRGELDA